MTSLSRVLRPALARHSKQLLRPLTTSSRALNGIGNAQSKELDVGEMEGITFKIQPLRRSGEDEGTLRARLQYQSRKRGMREGELLLSTFAAENLGDMSMSEMHEYDRLLDENDWDIYYWATQPEEAPPAEENPQSFEPKPAQGEWAQTVGAFRPAFRPVPTRWQGSKMLEKLRQHVEMQKQPRRSGHKPGMSFVPELKA